jgi:hypothetical protein
MHCWYLPCAFIRRKASEDQRRKPVKGDLVEGYIISVSGSKGSVQVRYLVEGYILLVLR